MPLPCEPSKLPRYPSSKELEARMRDEEAKRRRGEGGKGGKEDDANKISNTQKAIPEGQGIPNTSTNYQYNPDSSNVFPIVPPRVRNGCTHQSKSVIHPNAAGYSWNKKMNDDPGHSVHGLRHNHPAELMRQGTELRQPMVDSSDFHPKNGRRGLHNDSRGSRKNKINYSGPLMPPGGNVEEMLKEHERQIQVAVRKAQLNKDRSNAKIETNCYG